jgi:hypothetical protein
MTRARLTATIVGALAVLAIGVWAVATPGRHSASPAGVAAPPPARYPTGSAWPSPSSLPSSPSPSLSSPSPAGSVEPVRAAAAEPFVQTFADQPGVRPLPAVPSPTAKLSQPVNIDGCDHGYGERTQCIPWTFPPGTTDKCAWLTAHGFGAVKVVGKDRHHLDPDGDGLACDS